MPIPSQLCVHYLPQFVAEHDLVGSTVVVIDLLRASSTICQALASGAKDVVPFVEVSQAQAAAKEQDRADILLGGERGGKPIEGFDLGNSPAEYKTDRVLGRRLLFTTTNGTRALQHARLAERVLIGAMLNLSAVTASIKSSTKIDFLCAGTDAHVSREDILAAGAMVHSLSWTNWQTNDGAAAAGREWEELINTARAKGCSISDQLAEELRSTLGGRNLIAIGQENDLIDCAQIDQLDVVPELDLKTGRIHLP